ncbi:MAG TPA: GNAT family N-acetyltransferase [Actinocatenispora sp.]
MGLAVVAFEVRFVRPAAALLAARHADDPHGPDLRDPDVAHRVVRAWQGSGPALAAVRDGELVGFLAATLPAPPGNPVARVRLAQHAAADRDTYRRLYAALAGRLTAAGRFEHSIVVPAGDTVGHLVELGFGIDQIKGLRPVGPPEAAGAPAGVTVRPADPEETGVLLRLVLELQRFHAASPMLRPALIDLDAIRTDLDAARTDGDQVVLVAERDGDPVGMIQAGRDSRYRTAATIGIAAVTASARSGGVGGALVSGVQRWAAGRGFRYYGAGWTSANLVSDSFWRGRGFVPVAYTLTRLVDQRVAWADADLGYPEDDPGRTAPSTVDVRPRPASPSRAGGTGRAGR